MSDFDLCLTNPEVYEYLNRKEGQPLKDYLYDEIPLKEAAVKIYEYYESALWGRHLYLEKVMDILTLIAIDLSDSWKLKKIVKLLVALRNLRWKPMREFYLGYSVDLNASLAADFFELHASLTKYFRSEFYFLKIPVL